MCRAEVGGVGASGTQSHPTDDRVARPRSHRGCTKRLEVGEPQDLGDLRLCAVEEVSETSVGQPSVGLPDDLPPGLIDPESFGLWRLFTGPSSGRDPWADKIETDTHEAHHRPPGSTRSRVKSVSAQEMHSLLGHMSKFGETVMSAAQVSEGRQLCRLTTQPP